MSYIIGTRKRKVKETLNQYAHISTYYCNKTGFKQVTVRANGKAHRAAISPTGQLEISCKCPGSQNGRLRNRCTIIADGWENSNCEN